MTRVLVADDNQQNVYMLETILKSHGYQVTSTKNGAEALDEAIRNPPDIIIADILMPVMDGFKLCQLWKQNDKLNNIPFIFYTATYTDSKDEEFALSLGAERFLVKPQKPEVLLEVVGEVLEEHRSKVKVPARKQDGSEIQTLKEYNEVLFRKLEKKVMQLEIDVSERKAAEQALRQSEERFRKVFESGTIGIAILGPDDRLIRINDEFCKMLGYPEEELLKMRILDITHPDHRQADIENIRRLKDGEISIYETEKRYLTKGGPVVWSTTKVSTICDENGKLLYLIAFANDITEQKKMQEHERQALLQIEKNLEQLATLNDQIRNPLSVIIALLALQEKTKTTLQIIEAVREIDDIVKRLDMGWAESAKVRGFLQRYDQITRRE